MSETIEKTIRAGGAIGEVDEAHIALAWAIALRLGEFLYSELHSDLVGAGVDRAHAKEAIDACKERGYIRKSETYRMLEGVRP